MKKLAFFLFFAAMLVGAGIYARYAYAASSSVNLLKQQWIMHGNEGAVEKYQSIDPSVLTGKNKLKLTYNLHGTCLLDGDASAIIFDQPVNQEWHYISLSKYGNNCFDGLQSVEIPLSDFPQLDLSKPVGTFHVRFWNRGSYQVDLTKAVVYNSAGSIGITPSISPKVTPKPTTSANPTVTVRPTITVRPTATPTPTNIPAPTTTPSVGSTRTWEIQSVSSMKETKDKICGVDDASFVNKWVDKAVELGANYVAVETPYDNPDCGDAVAYTKLWVDTVHQKGLNVWHRHMPLAFEGIYDKAKSGNAYSYMSMITDYVKNHPDYFKEGDIFTPVPEPQNGGISGFTGCSQGVCMFGSISDFNKWLRDAIDQSNNAFSSIGLSGKIKTGYYGFDGFIVWGDNNPDWSGILEDETVAKMGNLTIDHYPQLVNGTMSGDLDELQAKYPDTPIIIGEWGTVGSADMEQQVRDNMEAAKRKNVIGFNYWHMGMGGYESLINDDFSSKIQFDDVQRMFRP